MSIENESVILNGKKTKRDELLNILFICSRNQWRSRTAEDLFKNHPLHQVRSAGTAPSARIKVSEKAIQWADLILVMEKRHKEILREKFGALIEEMEVMALDIPDEYGYMDPELVEILEWHWEIMLGFGKE